VITAKGDDPLRPVTVVVPTPYAGISLRRSLGSATGLINVRFMVMSRLAEFLGSPRLAEQEKAPLSPLVEQATIREIGREMADVGPLGPVALHSSLHSSLSSTFRDLDLLDEKGLEELAKIDPLRQQTISWYRLSRAKLEGYYTREQLAQAAATAVSQQKAEATLQDLGAIVFFLLDHLTPAESNLVNRLGELQTCYMLLGLTGEKTTDALAIDIAAATESVFSPADIESHGEYDFKAKQIVSAPDAHEEIRWVVRDLARRAEAGTPFHKMAVFYRQSDPYGTLIRSQLQMAGIPAAGPRAASDRGFSCPENSLTSYYEGLQRSGCRRHTIGMRLARCR